MEQRAAVAHCGHHPLLAIVTAATMNTRAFIGVVGHSSLRNRNVGATAIRVTCTEIVVSLWQLFHN